MAAQGAPAPAPAPAPASMADTTGVNAPAAVSGTAWLTALLSVCRAELDAGALGDVVAVQQKQARALFDRFAVRTVHSQTGLVHAELDIHGFKRIMVEEPKPHFSEARAEQLFYGMALASPNALTWEEFRLGVAAFSALHRGAWRQLRAFYIFRFYDTDHDGWWTLNDFAVLSQDIITSMQRALDPIATARAEWQRLVAAERLGFAELLYLVDGGDEHRRLSGTSWLWRWPDYSKVYPPAQPTEHPATPDRRPPERTGIFSTPFMRRPVTYVKDHTGELVPVEGLSVCCWCLTSRPSEDWSSLACWTGTGCLSTFVALLGVLYGDQPVHDSVVVLAQRIVAGLLQNKDCVPKDGADVRFKLCSAQDLIQLALRARKIFEKEDRVLTATVPLMVFGDIHGQLLDLLDWFTIKGTNAQLKAITRLCFLGDYVDRGARSLEVVALLFSLKILQGDQVSLLRGNHESRSINRLYGFWKECSERLAPAPQIVAEQVYEAVNDAFDYMPLVAFVQIPNVTRKLLCVHGGIGRIANVLDAVATIPRPLRDVSSSEAAMELLWSDPHHGNGILKNLQRGISTVFGVDVIERFCAANGVASILRGHEVVKGGYRWTGLQLLTIFSATNYCGVHQNAGGAVAIDEHGFMTPYTIQPRDRTWLSRAESPPASPRPDDL